MDSVLANMIDLVRRKEENSGKNDCNCPEESFTPSSRTFGHNSPPGRRLSSRKKETEGRIREMTGERRKGHTDIQRSRETRKKSWFASL